MGTSHNASYSREGELTLTGSSLTYKPETPAAKNRWSGDKPVLSTSSEGTPGYKPMVRVSSTQPNAVSKVKSSGAASNTLEKDAGYITVEATLGNIEELATLQRQVTFLRRELRQAKRQIEEHNTAARAVLSEAAANSVAVFILAQIVSARRLDLDLLTENLTAPFGWVAFAKLWRAGLIDCIGNTIVPTNEGADLVKWFERQDAKLQSSPGEQ